MLVRRSRIFAPSIEGAYAFVLNNNAAIVIDALVHFDAYTSDMHDFDDSLPQYQASAHYLHPLGEKLIVGGYAGYGFAPFDDSDEEYQVGFIGGTVVYKASDVISIFGQAGYGTSFDAVVMSSAGFFNGYTVRAGVIYTGLANASIRAEAEYASTERYEGPDEPGEMWTVAVLGESQLAVMENMAVTYGVRYGSFDALTDSDLANETTVSVGFKYMFGGATTDRFTEIGYVGSPYLPLRGSFWTPTMD